MSRGSGSRVGINGMGNGHWEMGAGRDGAEVAEPFPDLAQLKQKLPLFFSLTFLFDLLILAKRF